MIFCTMSYKHSLKCILCNMKSDTVKVRYRGITLPNIKSRLINFQSNDAHCIDYILNQRFLIDILVLKVLNALAYITLYK